MRKNGYRLSTLLLVQKYISSVINRVECGEISDLQATKRCYCANILTNVIRSKQLVDIEERLDTLEINNNEDGIWST